VSSVALVHRTAPARRAALLAVLAALAAGLLLAAALPPIGFLPGVLGFAVLALLVHRCAGAWQAAAAGFAFGYAYFLAGLYWVAIAFYTDAERFGALAVPAVLLLAAACALFPTMAVVAARRLARGSLLALVLLLPVTWTLAEQLRGDWGAGFPWNPAALVWAAADPWLQPAAWLGTPGLSLLAVLGGALPALALAPTRRLRLAGPVAAALLLVALWGAGSARLALLDPPPDTALRLRIVQANIEQHHKWDPELRLAWFRRHLELAARATATPPDLVIWPESSVPYPLEDAEEVRAAIARITPADGFALVGGDRFDLAATPPVASNSIFALDRHGAIRERYDKVDLVPFGEYLPFRPLLERFGLEKLTAGSFDFVPGPGRRTIALDGVPPFSPLVCYEAIFAGRAVAAEARPAWLLNVTNDAWFGRSSGPYQHLAMARMRAVEEGLPLVRAANTGISVVTDAFGRVRAELPLGTTGVIDEPLPGALEPPTLRYRIRDLPAWALALGLAVAGLLAARRATVD
jgi:apolipoprotein N-acyltransferase